RGVVIGFPCEVISALAGENVRVRAAVGAPVNIGDVRGAGDEVGYVFARLVAPHTRVTSSIGARLCAVDDAEGRTLFDVGDSAWARGDAEREAAGGKIFTGEMRIVFSRSV